MNLELSYKPVLVTFYKLVTYSLFLFNFLLWWVFSGTSRSSFYAFTFVVLGFSKLLLSLFLCVDTPTNYSKGAPVYNFKLLRLRCRPAGK
jgi:hypothetical protein